VRDEDREDARSADLVGRGQAFRHGSDHGGARCAAGA
jgi:hypothetical protein